MHKLQAPSGEAVSYSSKIASLFQEYYAKLYNLDAKLTPEAQTSKLTSIHDYLTSAGLPSLTVEQQMNLESPITLIERGLW